MLNYADHLLGIPRLVECHRANFRVPAHRPVGSIERCGYDVIFDRVWNETLGCNTAGVVENGDSVWRFDETGLG